MSSTIYETDELLAQYLAFHYPDLSDYCPWPGAPLAAISFAQRVADFALAHAPSPSGYRSALDLGCAVGGTTFELTKAVPRVVGVDLSAKFIAAADQLRTHGRLDYDLKLEGARSVRKTATLGCHIRPERVEFIVGDAMCPADTLIGFDLVIMANLLCRTPDPRRVLSHLPRLLAQGGTLVVTTPGTWLEEYTPRDLWLCDERRDTFTGLREALGADFTLVEHHDLPMLIREHRRKFQLTWAEATVWKRS